MQSFSDYEFPPPLAKSIDSIGFKEPTFVQFKAIPVLLKGKDLMACAETGSGKTAAYILPMMDELIRNSQAQGMIMAPTRELAQQIYEFLLSLIKDRQKFHTTLLVGGKDIRKQFKSLQRKPRIIVATPGRLIDHLKRNTLQINKVNHLVLDEGDRMIDMGFAPQLDQILKYLPKERQTSFFTATIDPKVKKLASKYLNNPESLMLSDSRPVSKIRQSAIKVDRKFKDECILDELAQRDGSVIVFVKTKRKTSQLSDFLADYGVPVDQLHGGRSQGQRNRAINAFKKGRVRVLCATDVAARGLDVPQVQHVINFDLPMQDEDYVHRIGRTARNGADGEAISLVTPEDYGDWNHLVAKYDIPNAHIEGVTAKKSKAKKSGKKKTKGGPRKKIGKKSRFQRRKVRK